MIEHFFGRVEEFDETSHRVRVIAGIEVGVFKLDSQWVAWENSCPHAGGPVCQGRIMPRLEEQLDANQQSLGMCFSKVRQNVVCPWHGYEYDLRTGVHQGHSSYRLRPVALALRGRDIFVQLPEGVRLALGEGA